MGLILERLDKNNKTKPARTYQSLFIGGPSCGSHHEVGQDQGNASRGIRCIAND